MELSRTYRLLPVLAALTLTSCSTINRETAYEGASGSAYVVVVADGMIVNGSQSYSFAFQKIEAEKQTFQPEIFSVAFSGMGTMEGDEFKKPDTLHTPLRFGGKGVLPGDYALIARYDHASYGYANSLNSNCFSLGTRVFRIRPGQVNVIYAGDVKGNASGDLSDLVQQTQTVLSGYPKISAPLAFADSIGTVVFETKEKTFLGGPMCKATGVTSYAPTAAARAGSGSP